MGIMWQSQVPACATLGRYHASPLCSTTTRKRGIVCGAWRLLEPLQPVLVMWSKQPFCLLIYFHFVIFNKQWYQHMDWFVWVVFFLGGSRHGDSAVLMRQRDENFHIIDGEEAWLAMKHPFIPVFINLVSEGNYIALFKTEFPFIFWIKVIQRSATRLVHSSTYGEGRKEKQNGWGDAMLASDLTGLNNQMALSMDRRRPPAPWRPHDYKQSTSDCWKLVANRALRLCMILPTAGSWLMLVLTC